MEQFKSPACSHVKEVRLILSHDFICSKVVIFMCFVSHWLNCFSVRLALLVLNIVIICFVPIWVVEKTGSLIICLSFNQNISHKVLIFWWSFMFFLPETNHWEYNVYWLFAVNESRNSIVEGLWNLFYDLIIDSCKFFGFLLNRIVIANYDVLCSFVFRWLLF